MRLLYNVPVCLSANAAKQNRLVLQGLSSASVNWPWDAAISWKMHRHVWHHMLGRDMPVVLGRVAGQDVVIEVMALGWLAWVTCCRCLGVVASYDPLRLRGWDSGIWLPLLRPD